MLELDLRAVKFLFFPRRDLNTHHSLQHHSLSLTSSTLDHSTTSTPYIYILTRHRYCVNTDNFSVAAEIFPCLPPHNKRQGSSSPGIELPQCYQSTTSHNMDITFLYVQLTCKKQSNIYRILAVLMVETDIITVL